MKVFVTGSADGLGKMAAELLIEQGHQVVLHARSNSRAADLKRAVPEAAAVVVGDFSSIAQTRSVAEQVNKWGELDSIIHNAGVGYREPKKILTEDGLSHLFSVNVLAPYILTALIQKPRRLVYLSSGMHLGAGTGVDDLNWVKRSWSGSSAYAETKFQDVLLTLAVARIFPKIFSNSLEPGWVPTKMGGAGAPDDLDQAHRTQVWLAVSNDPSALVTGQYFYHERARACNPSAKDIHKQDSLLTQCRDFSGVKLE